MPATGMRRRSSRSCERRSAAALCSSRRSAAVWPFSAVHTTRAKWIQGIAGQAVRRSGVCVRTRRNADELEYLCARKDARTAFAIGAVRRRHGGAGAFALWSRGRRSGQSGAGHPPIAGQRSSSGTSADRQRCGLVRRRTVARRCERLPGASEPVQPTDAGNRG